MYLKKYRLIPSFEPTSFTFQNEGVHYNGRMAGEQEGGKDMGVA